MGRIKFKKWLIPLALGGILLGGGMVSENFIARADSVTASIDPIVIRASHTAITINDSTLDSAIRKLLGKESTATLYSDDFLNSEKYKATTITDEGTGISTTTALNYQLDLSNTGVTDIRELCKFEFPETLQGINLCGNGITSEHLTNITTLISSTTDTPLVIGKETVTPASNFSTIIKKVNLNNNSIDLFNLSSSHLNNTKFLFGIQNFGSINSSGFVQQGEIDPVYYIRSNSDENYMTFSFVYEYSTMTGSTLTKKYDTPTRLLDLSSYARQNGKLSITVASLPNSSTAYFSGYEFHREFILFDISIDEDFEVERKSLLNLNIVDGKITADCPLNIDGFGTSLDISYNNPSTSLITTDTRKHYVNITLSYQGNTRTIPVEFKVVDTITPVIELIGSSHVYSSKNNTFKDPGYIAYDPATIGTENGDDLTSMVVTQSSVNINALGEYTIIYTVTDLAGNSTSVTRIVEIEESVLDRLTLRTNTLGDLIAGEDIILVVQPDGDINLDNYSIITYKWYINGTKFTETKGDKVTGKSTTTINLTTIGTSEVYVIATATQLVDDIEIEVFSDTLPLNINANLRNNDTLILAVSVALGVIILIIIIISISNYRKGKGKTSGKHKNFHKGKKSGSGTSHGNPNQPEIKVIRDFRGDTGSGGGSGGGNQSFRLPESNSNNDNNGMNK